VTAIEPLGSFTNHVVLPLIAFVILAAALELTRVDAWLATRLFEWEGGAWALRPDPFVRDVLHDGAKRVIGVVYALIVMGCAASFWVTRLRRYRWGLVYLVATMAASTLSIAVLKGVTHVHCPWSIAGYGGQHPYLPSLQAIAARAPSGRCFPSGHAGSAYAFVSSYFLCRLYAPRWRWLALGCALIVGTTLGAAQQLRGAHFVSHDVWALAICWFIACAATPILRRVGSDSRSEGTVSHSGIT